jgi:hypothetical protein
MSKRQRVEWPDSLWIYGALFCRGPSSCTLWHIQIIGTSELFSSLLRYFRRSAGGKLPGSAPRKHSSLTFDPYIEGALGFSLGFNPTRVMRRSLPNVQILSS